MGSDILINDCQAVSFGNIELPANYCSSAHVKIILQSTRFSKSMGERAGSFVPVLITVMKGLRRRLVVIHKKGLFETALKMK